jgi:hypothetical protein
MVVIISDAASGQAVLSVIIESQLREHETKQYSWPVYVASARRVRECPAAVLLVICPDQAEAVKCAEVIRTGHPGFDLAPIVISPNNAPDGDDTAPWLTVFAACLGAVDLEDRTGAQHVLTAIKNTRAGVADRRRMITLILNLASEAARKILQEMTMTLPELKGYWLDDIEDRGKASAKAEDILKVLDARHLDPTDGHRKQVTACSDIAQLDRWFDRALTASTVADVFSTED